MPDDTERLVVMLEARVRDFERNMAKAEGTATRSYTGMRRGSHSATRQMEQDMVRSTNRINQALASTSSKIGMFAKSFVAGGLAGVAAGVTAGALLDIAKGVAEIGDEARRAGLDIEAFQQLRYVAEQNRIGVDSLVDGIKELNLRADEFIVTGGGSAAEAFKRLGYDATILKQKLEDPSELFTEIIGKLGELDRAAQIRVADEVFGGTGGEKFVQLIDLGADGIRKMQQQAQDLGIVISGDLVDKASELDAAIKTAADTVGSNLKSAIVDAGWQLYDFLQQWWSFQDRTTGSLQTKLSNLSEERKRLEAEIGGRRGLALDNAGLSPAITAGTVDYVTRQGLEDARQALAEVIRQEREINSILEERQGAAPKDRPPTITTLPTKDELAGAASGLKSVADAANEITVPLETSNLALEQMQANIAMAEDLAQSFASGLISDLMSGKGAVESVADALGSLGQQLIQMAANQAISGLFGALFGAPSLGIGPNRYGGGGGFFMGLPSFAGGGSTGTGSRSGGVDGMGGYPAIVHPNETIVDHAAGQMMGGISITNVMHFGPGTTAADAGSIATEVTRQLRAQGPAMIEAYNRNPSRRHSPR